MTNLGFRLFLEKSQVKFARTSDATAKGSGCESPQGEMKASHQKLEVGMQNLLVRLHLPSSCFTHLPTVVSEVFLKKSLTLFKW